jgi:hypothetical protein
MILEKEGPSGANPEPSSFSQGMSFFHLTSRVSVFPMSIVIGSMPMKKKDRGTIHFVSTEFQAPT